jgi:ESCRT-II complex subunit VPS22
MHRRGAGVAAIKQKSLAQARFKDKGSEIASEQLSQLSKQVESFRTYLEEFATKHRDDIRRSPQFRNQFQEMCAAIGVDPLASSKGFWSKLGVGDFYYELGVQIVEVCLATRHRNGGLMSLEELKQRLVASRGRNRQEISSEDILTAIRKLKILGNGFTIIPVGTRYLIQSVPGELTMDHTMVLQQTEGQGYVSLIILKTKLGWEDERITRALDFMVTEGLAWVDGQSSAGKLYWFPGLFTETLATSPS